MNFNSPVACLVSNINVSAKHKRACNKCVFSKLNLNILKKLRSSNVIASFEVCDDGPYKLINFKLNVIDGLFMLSAAKLISKPGGRVYVSYNNVKKHMSYYKYAIVSTNCGLMNAYECFKNRIGGELILVYL